MCTTQNSTQRWSKTSRCVMATLLVTTVFKFIALFCAEIVQRVTFSLICVRVWMCPNQTIWFNRTSRSDFKREPCKMCFLDGWSVQVVDNPQQVNTFQLANSQLGTIYKFRTGSTQMTSLWLTSLRRIANAMAQHQQEERALPVNLMSFE